MTLISLQNFQVELICLHLEGQVKASVWKYLFKKLTPTCSFSGELFAEVTLSCCKFLLPCFCEWEYVYCNS